MNFRNEIKRQIEESIAVKQRLAAEEIEKCAALFIETLRRGGKILFCGNGGSAADSQHLAAELVVRLRSEFDRPSIPAMALTVDTSILTAGSNDFGFEEVFARQIEALGQPGDLLVAISTSGNSPNILRAIEAARAREMITVGLSGKDGGKMKNLVDLAIVVLSSSTARIQECHILIGHIVCQLVEETLFPQ